MFKKVKKNDILSRILSSTSEINMPVSETILSEVKNPTGLQANILYLNKFFNYYKFFSGTSGTSERETAIGIITPKQSLMIECELADVDDHGYNFQALYDAIYDSKVNIIPVRSGTNCWQENVMDDGNIAIQFSRNFDFLIWCPRKINEFQLKSLQRLNQAINDFLFLISTSTYFDNFIFIAQALIRADGGEETIDLVARDNVGCVNRMSEFLSYYTEITSDDSSEKKYILDFEKKKNVHK